MGLGGIRRIPPFRRYLRRQVSLSNCGLMCEGRGSEMGPCLRRGLQGEGGTLSSHTAVSPAFTGARPR